MKTMGCSTSTPVWKARLMPLTIVVAGLLVLAVAGCSAASGQNAMASGAPSGQAKPMMMGGANTDPSVPSCYECSKKRKPPVTEGTSTVENGMQVVNIKVVNGYYVPNKVIVRAGMPTKVVFSGKTKDCVGKPKFGSLNKQVDIRKTGSGTIDLGSLSAGTYTFTCGMDVNEGSIIAQ
jgi:hypothetical protein